MEQTSLWWIRRDLRLRDNQALHAALEAGEKVIPVFILDPLLLSSSWASEKRTAFLFGGLRSLDNELRRRGSYLVVRRGDPLEQLSILMRESGAGKLFAERDYSPYARRRDRAVGDNLPLKLVGGLTIHHPDLILKADGSPYTVFTPFKRRWMEMPAPGMDALRPAPDHIPTPPDIVTLDIPNKPLMPDSVPFMPGEREAVRRLETFVHGGSQSALAKYADRRNRMDLDGTSGLSPYLRFGMLSAREAASAAVQARSDSQDRQGADTWLSELIWREFYIAILYHFPHVLGGSFRRVYNHIDWRNDKAEFELWCQGRTGYPVVDAAMRQLAQSGWMHNRARMIAASFLVKDLLIDWRWGEKWFMQHLVDGDPAANNGGWQWTAGTGTDAAPYFRIFNPVLQGKKFDPQGDYVRRWLAELVDVPAKYLQEPWKMPPAVQEAAGCIIGLDYPNPIVDHAFARERTLAAYALAREQAVD
ncbi:MAG: cryptochrome/photolyase family protein [Candidatus Promineifilaceae bacterium]